MKIGIFVVITLIACTNAASIVNDDLFENEWQIFKIKHTKIYDNHLEEKYRREIFLNNKHKIDTHNEKFKKGLVSFKLGINKYADLSQSELVKMVNGVKINEDIQGQFINFKMSKNSTNHTIPETFDWREHGAVTRVKNQGNCASCWAFSTTGSLEGQYFLKTGKLIELSEQNLIDCSSSFGNNGCNDGLMDRAFRYIISNGGIDKEITYPYEGINNSCRYNLLNIGTNIKDYIVLPSGNEKILKEAVATIGPISAIMDANHTSINFYKGGIIYEPQCSSSRQYLNHGILIVGYGTDKISKQDYWIVKNSWGKKWGENGYFRLIRNKGNHCGIATFPIYPLI